MDDRRITEIKTLLPQAMVADWVRLGSRLVRLVRDRHHPAQHNALLDRLLARARDSVALRQRRAAIVPQVSYPPELPITARKAEIVAAIKANQVVVVVGETGSGKTTQLPKMCLEAGLGIEALIGCTQPRRIAALSISRRIAEELNVEQGREVGCKIRFDNRASPETFIKLMTDGILLAETQGDPLLSEYNAIIIDEAHERSLNIDFLLGYLKGLLARRPELKLIITSATIDATAFSKAFNDAPIIEVSGRLYPVEVVYAPLNPESEEAGELTSIDATARTVEQILCEPGEGDVLVFMPTERDIRETTDLLKTRFGDVAELIPLFARLSAGDQQRVFAASPKRKVVVATNIAETSLTIPGIRYVIDSGLARISRYNPRTRTKRLPIEPVSQSSANQRKGRSGRVSNGVCIRLYSEQDFLSRPPHTQPEIQRANLAEVILRMKAFRLGEIETFPFLNPPSPAAVDGGYRLLQELGALDENRGLTALGRDLARLPIDPTLGRMLLHAQDEHATRELLIIATGLSIQDPRERPLDQQQAASTAHRRFADPQSDFLSLLNLWNGVHEQWENLRSQNQRRKFCKASFLSYNRMREWQDLHAQLHDALEELGTLRLNESNAGYDAIHRSILAGLLGHAATWTERNRYQGAGNRLLTLYPGSALYERGAQPRPKGGKAAKPVKEAKSNQPEWIVAGEIVETSQLFARTVAGIDPLWIVQLAPHLCKVTHHNPHWSPEAGRVLVEERVTFYGLEIQKRKAAFGNIDPKKATDIFIRSALVEETLFPEAQHARRDQEEAHPTRAGRKVQAPATEERPTPALYKFLEHNRQVRHKIETWQTRARRHDLGNLDDAFCAFYARHIENISSVHELNRLLRGKADCGFLCATETDLAAGLDLSFDAQAFPDSVRVADQPIELSYAYSPGEEHDGVTLKVGFSLAQSVSPAALEWAVPGLRESQISELLRSLPKSLRKELMPLAPKVSEIVREFRPGGNSLKQDLARFIHQRYGVEIPPDAWPEGALPNHLHPRVEIVDHHKKTISAGRDLLELRQGLATPAVKKPPEDAGWLKEAARWERFGLSSWTIGEVPARITVSDSGPVYAWPGLQLEAGQVNLRLFRTQAAATEASLPGLQRLVELVLQKDLAWLQKDLRALVRFEPLLAGLCSAEQLQETAFANLRLHALPWQPLAALTPTHFNATVEAARQKLPGLASALIDRLEPVLKLRHELLRRYWPAPAAVAPRPKSLSDLKRLGTASHTPAAPVFAEDLQSLMPPNFLELVPHDRLPHLQRYLKAMLTRAERAALNPVKDRQRAAQVAPYTTLLKQYLSAARTLEAREAVASFCWMVEEFKVSVYAQELGTAFPVSPARLDQQAARVRQVLG